MIAVPTLAMASDYPDYSPADDLGHSVITHGMLNATLDSNSTEMYEFYNNTPWQDTGQQPVGPETSDALYKHLWEIVIVGILLGLITLVTILGNLLVMVTVVTNHRLHNPTNYFILNLATADACLGLIVLPFSTLTTIWPVWPLGPEFCNVYIATDVTLCTVSILTLFAISVDRYFAVTVPLQYQRKVSSRLVWKVCAGIWGFSAVMAYLPIHLGWNTMDGKIQNYDNPTSCLFNLNKGYALFVSLATYFAPLICMCGVYMKVLFITKKQVNEINKLSVGGPAKSMLGNENKRQRQLVSDTKATITLASLVLAFAICWIPYFSLFTAKPFIDTEINVHLDLTALWLGYVNSLINPFLYAYYNSAFRDAFVRILCRGCRDRNVMFSGDSPYSKRKPTLYTDTSELSVLNGRHNNAV